MTLELTQSDIDRFWSKVKMAQPDECWKWRSSISKDGYGYIAIGGRQEIAHQPMPSHTTNFLVTT